ncbi:hypothetical protein CCZ01_05250 [Helicobacter monodelphidis]|uniref:ABC transporter ATP-binding protein n=1 Tax=Helicobacter sp. 15-1451 TaxID=2004995 RepID=UPI000DCBDDBB|nr:ABC transporter ATP-binding protein [Helicobacter sp. 15-1451]RAX57695.1 hypothetical protein CCZ01_05250 [Helicobacter sp. 15-1451]
MNQQECLNIQDLYVQYGDKKVLNGLNITLHRGEMLGVLGANGCGKSSLLKTILGSIQPSKGILNLFGTPIQQMNPKKIAQTIAYIPQHSSLSMSLRVEDLLYMGRYPHKSNLWASHNEKDHQKVYEVAKLLNVWEMRHQNTQTLSGGELQRTLLARALISEPQILLLDEPTSALDLRYAIEILEICEHLVKDMHLAMLIVIHDLNLASLFCGQGVLMRDGKVFVQGKMSEILTTQNIQAVYGLESEVIRHSNRHIIVPKKGNKFQSMAS